MHEQEGGSDLRQAADHGPQEEMRIRNRQRPIESAPEDRQIEKRERHAVTEAHERRPGRAHHALQVFLHGGADVLQKGSRDGDDDPGLHLCGLACGPAYCQSGGLRKAVQTDFS